MVCDLCPRRCGALRDEAHGEGFCRMPALPVCARAALHFWEEPCISGRTGAGTVFFSGCTLGCVFCQNRSISREGEGKALSPDELYAVFRRLADQGRAVVLVLHDLCLALRWADQLAVLDSGRLQMADSPERVFTSGILDRVFEVNVRRFQTPNGWQYYCEGQTPPSPP